MTGEEAIKYWEQFDAEIDELAADNLYEEQMDALEKQREVVEFTISALRAQQTIHVTDLYDEDGGEVYRTKQEHFRDGTKKVEPLTLEDLRQMDGEPVWVEPNDSCPPHWRIWSNSEPFDMAVFKAYRRKPEEGTV